MMQTPIMPHIQQPAACWLIEKYSKTSASSFYKLKQMMKHAHTQKCFSRSGEELMQDKKQKKMT